MIVDELKVELDRLGIPQNFYFINGHLYSHTHMLNQVYVYWEFTLMKGEIRGITENLKMRKMRVNTFSSH